MGLFLAKQYIETEEKPVEELESSFEIELPKVTNSSNISWILNMWQESKKSHREQ